MRNSMNFSTSNLQEIFDASKAAKSTTTKSGKNAQYYKERLEAHILDLSVSDVDAVRLAVVSSTNASASVLKSMLENECNEEIIGVILTHPNLSKTVKTAYIKKNEELVKSIIAKADDQQPSDDHLTEEEVNQALQS